MAAHGKTRRLRNGLQIVAGGVALSLLLLALPSAGIAQAKNNQQQKKGNQQPGALPPEAAQIFDQFAKIIPGGRSVFPFANIGEAPNRLGAALEPPSDALVDQLGLPANQGVLLKSLKAGSAASLVGLKANDILLELAGNPVPSNLEACVKLVNEIKKDTPVDAVVLRKGKRETIEGLKLGDVPQQAAGNAFGGIVNGIGNGGVIRINGKAANNNATPKARNVSTTRGPNGEFTTRYKDGTTQITVAGKTEDGKANVASIEVRSGDKTNTYKSISEIPEELREDVRWMIREVEFGPIGGTPKKKSGK